MKYLWIVMILAASAAAGAAGRQQTQGSRPAVISIEDVDARATISGCLAREAAARNKPQPALSDPKVGAEIIRQAKDPRRVEQCRRVLAQD